VTSAAAQESEVQKETVTFSAPDREGRVFVHRKHDGVVLELAREAARALQPDASLVRSRNIFDYPLDRVSRLEIDGEPKQVLLRSEKGALTLEQPAGFGADGALATEALDSLRTMTADRWVSDEDDGSFGLDEPTLRARLTVRAEKKVEDGETAEHEVILGRPAPSGYYATVRGDPGVFVVPRRVYEVLTTLTIDRSLFLADPAMTASIEIRTPERRFAFERQGTDFVQTGGDEMLPPAAIQRIIEALSAMRPEAAVSLGPPRNEYGQDRPLLVVRVERDPGLGDHSKPVVWRVGAGASWRGISVHYARVEGTGATFVLPRNLVQQLLESV
jgi:hypothetical protein